MKKSAHLSDKVWQNVDGESQQHRNGHELWSRRQIEIIFTLYNDYGPQWSLIVQQLPQRPSNSIKNRFYTFLRNTLKGLFRQHPEIKKKLPHQIPSKEIRKLYEGINEYTEFNGLLRKIIYQSNYENTPWKMKQAIKAYKSEILMIFNTIYKGETNQQIQTYENIEIRQDNEQHKNPTSNNLLNNVPAQYNGAPGIIYVPHFYFWGYDNQNNQT